MVKLPHISLSPFHPLQVQCSTKTRTFPSVKSRQNPKIETTLTHPVWAEIPWKLMLLQYEILEKLVTFMNIPYDRHLKYTDKEGKNNLESSRKRHKLNDKIMKMTVCKYLLMCSRYSWHGVVQYVDSGLFCLRHQKRLRLSNCTAQAAGRKPCLQK